MRVSGALGRAALQRVVAKQPANGLQQQSMQSSAHTVLGCIAALAQVRGTSPLGK